MLAHIRLMSPDQKERMLAADRAALKKAEERLFGMMEKGSELTPKAISGAIFVLKNMGWADNPQEVDVPFTLPPGDIPSQIQAVLIARASAELGSRQATDLLNGLIAQLEQIHYPQIEAKYTQLEEECNTLREECDRLEAQLAQYQPNE